jgi:UPF0716 protein FxsA
MWILLAILALPFIEIALFVTLGAKLGLWFTLAWIVLTGVLGVIVLKGVAMLGIDQMAVGIREELRDPQSPLAHRFLVGIAGLCLLLPGFFTDAVGLLLLFPPIRRVLISFIKSRMSGGAMPRGTVVDGDWRDVTQAGDPPSASPPDSTTRH